MEKVSLLCGPLESQLIVKVQYKSEPKLAHSRQRDPGEVLLLDTFLRHVSSFALWPFGEPAYCQSAQLHQSLTKKEPVIIRLQSFQTPHPLPLPCSVTE